MSIKLTITAFGQSRADLLDALDLIREQVEKGFREGHYRGEDRSYTYEVDESDKRFGSIDNLANVKRSEFPAAVMMATDRELAAFVATYRDGAFVDIARAEQARRKQ